MNERHLIAYLLLLLLVVALGAVVARLIYTSQGRVIRRQRLAAKARRDRNAGPGQG